jgi:hypothetical protein
MVRVAIKAAKVVKNQPLLQGGNGQNDVHRAILLHGLANYLTVCLPNDDQYASPGF